MIMLSIQPVSRSGLPSSRTRQILGFFRCVTPEMMTPSNETLGMDQTLLIRQIKSSHTVDGRNPAPVSRWFLALFTGF